MEKQQSIGEFISRRTKKEIREENRNLDRFMREYAIPKSNYYLKKWVWKLGYSIRDDKEKTYKVLYRGAKRVAKWNEYVDYHFKKHIWNLILDRVAKEEVSILEGNRSGLPEEEFTQEKILAYLPPKYPKKFLTVRFNENICFLSNPRNFRFQIHNNFFCLFSLPM